MHWWIISPTIQFNDIAVLASIAQAGLSDLTQNTGWGALSPVR